MNATERRTDLIPEGEYEDITRGHPWELNPRHRGELLRCGNCLLDLDLTRDGENAEVTAARIMPSAASVILGQSPGDCGGRRIRGGKGYFLRRAEDRRMVRVAPRDFYHAIRGMSAPEGEEG